ncbi:hypothetical protein Bca52824_056715 [Brassica carinata]|uniref:Uncharacterized protein n=1 Tax=Brassica carinata TaxID=52824 RepID=A0A8X7QPC2_BRACI|nr:hypothetical protein Bca52824_056715 [Brassica carinata]
MELEEEFSERFRVRYKMFRLVGFSVSLRWIGKAEKQLKNLPFCGLRWERSRESCRLLSVGTKDWVLEYNRMCILHCSSVRNLGLTRSYVAAGHPRWLDHIYANDVCIRVIVKQVVLLRLCCCMEPS